MLRSACFSAICISILAPLNALAHANHAPTPSPWDGTNAQAGYILNTGNSKSMNINLATNIIYKQTEWQNTFLTEFQYAEQSSVANKQQLHFNDQAQFNLHNLDPMRSFLFANADSLFTRFNPYSNQTVVAGGYGVRLIKTQSFLLTVQAGPGFRYSKVQNSSETEKDPIITTQANAELKLGKFGTLTQSARYDIAKPYSFLRTVTSLTNKITGHIAIKGSYIVTNYSRVPSSSNRDKKTDTVTNISIVYNF